MSKVNPQGKRVSVADLRQKKTRGDKISMITCYDSAFGRLIDESSIDVVLVGDSLGNVVLGFDHTIPVTVDMMVHHAAAVARSVKRAFVAVDMPFMSYKVSTEQALAHAARMIQESGAQAVKLEGGAEVCQQIKAITSAGIPVIAHLGLTPQSIHAVGGHKVQGRGEQAERLLADAKACAEAGAFCLVLELVPATLAKRVTEELEIPTIGIGAGAGCDGQVLVLHDMLGFDPGFQPKFLRRFANLHELIGQALNEYDSEVKSGSFPGREHEYED